LPVDLLTRGIDIQAVNVVISFGKQFDQGCSISMPMLTRRFAILQTLPRLPKHTFIGR
jgi:hypothetical protein